MDEKVSAVFIGKRDRPDLPGTVVDIELTETDKPFAHTDTITLVFNVPRDFPT